MAWSDAARRAAAEARRAKARTRGSNVTYFDREYGSFPGSKGYGSYAFRLESTRGGAAHKVFMPSMKYSEAKKRILKMAKRISARIKRPVDVTKLS